MKNVKSSALSLCVLTLVVVCGLVYSTGVSWMKYDYRSTSAGYRCVPNETLFEADDIDSPPTCGRMCHLNKKCLSFFYQPDNRKCIGCRVFVYAVPWANRHENLPGSKPFSHRKRKLRTNCKDILKNDPSAASGLYDITIEDTTWTVYCDMTTEGGGWTVFQNRFDGSVDFFRNFSEYENGFGEMYGEFWLGLRYIQILTDKYPSELMLVLTNAGDTTAYEQYEEFRLLDGANYTQSVSGRSTNISKTDDKYRFFDNTNGTPFSTFELDRDSDDTGSCAIRFRGAWWFKTCTTVHLNGEYCTPGTWCSDDRGAGFYVILHQGFA